MNLIVTGRAIASAALLALALMAACGLRSTNYSSENSSETLTVYQDAPKISLLDLGPPGNSPGDVYHFLLRYTRAPAVQFRARCLAQGL